MTNNEGSKEHNCVLTIVNACSLLTYMLLIPCGETLSWSNMQVAGRQDAGRKAEPWPWGCMAVSGSMRRVEAVTASVPVRA